MSFDGRCDFCLGFGKIFGPCIHARLSPPSLRALPPMHGVVPSWLAGQRFLCNQVPFISLLRQQCSVWGPRAAVSVTAACGRVEWACAGMPPRVHSARGLAAQRTLP
eukprot:8444793-Alexandrium_andersonii.AAC.1